MKKIDKNTTMEYLKQSSQLRSKEQKRVNNGSKSKASIESIALFWAFMSQAFGSKWTSQHGDKPHGLWLSELQNLTDDQIRNGTQLIKEFGQDFPPSLPAFVTYCTKGKPKKKADDVVRPNFNQVQLRPQPYELPNPESESLSEIEIRARMFEKLGNFRKANELRAKHEIA